MPPAKRKLRVKAPTGERIYVEVVGRGPTIICCTGVGASLSYWKYLEAQLRGRYRLVFWDYRGHGRSAWPKAPETCDVEHLVADLEAVRRAARERRWPFRIVWSLMQHNPLRIDFQIGRLTRIIHPQRATRSVVCWHERQLALLSD